MPPKVMLNMPTKEGSIKEDDGRSLLFDSMESEMFVSKNKSLEKNINTELHHKNPVIQSKSVFAREVVMKAINTEE